MRVGIYAGTFDPVHSGHISFALQALTAASLEAIYFLPERRPRAKQHVEHFAHRMAMIKKAVKPHPQLHAMELVDVSFSVERTLPFLQQQFGNDQLVFLIGSDLVSSLATWPHIDRLFSESELVIGLRHDHTSENIHAVVDTWPTKPQAITLFPSFAPNISSGAVRQALRSRQQAAGLLKSVERYSDQNWLYITLNR